MNETLLHFHVSFVTREIMFGVLESYYQYEATSVSSLASFKIPSVLLRAFEGLAALNAIEV